MTIIQRTADFAASLLNFIVRLLYLPLALFSWAASFLAYIPALLFLAGIAGGMYFVVTYGDVAVENVEFGMRCRVYPFWQTNVRPILDGIIRRFFNPLICWWNGFVWFPYGVIRQVIFPTLRDCGFLSAVIAFGDFLKAVFVDFVLNYLATRNFLQNDLDFTQICSTWQAFFALWQGIWCCGCNDLCPLFTKTPAFFPPFIVSDQLGDSQTWCLISNTFNGTMKFFQAIWQIVQEIVYGTLGALPRPMFRDAFDRWCAASTCFWKSMENAFQTFWDNFIPFGFVWTDFFCMFDVMTCTMLRSINLLIKLFVFGDKVLEHFDGTDSTFWNDVVKNDFKEIINLWGPSSYFAPITQALPGGQTMEITNYQLLTTVEARPDGKPNPVFGKLTVTNCSCIFMTRIFCDPLNNGTTCAQRYNGTLLETFDFCCFGTSVIKTGVDMAAYGFEFTLHLKSANDFIVFLDRQPFTTFIKTSMSDALKCLYGIFLVVDQYGKCIQTVLSELTLFAFCMIEFLYRVIVAAVTLPYYETYLPGIYNFITEPGDMALNMAIGFLDRLVATGPDSLLNCLCFLLNTGFPVPPASCTGGCVVGGFVTPTMKFQSQMNPIYDYSKKELVTVWNAQRWYEEITLQKTGDAFRDVHARLDYKLERFSDQLSEKKCQRQAEKLSTTPPEPPIACDPPPPCFDLCCLPKSVLVLFAQSTAFGFRAINAAFQTRNGTGSPYWTGTGCATGPCFQSDATALIINLIAPLKCVCNFIHLVIPPSGFPDPCCFFTLLGEGLACILMVIINIVTSMTSDPNYTYIKDPNGLLHDFDVILDIANATFECLCTFIRVIFGLITTQVNLVKNYDPCCIVQKLFRTLIEIIRMAGQILISLATLEEPNSQCYFYIQSATRPTCQPTVTTLPILVQFDRIRAVLLAPPPAAVLAKCAAQVDPTMVNQNEEGIATCICTLLNAVLAQVFKQDPNSPLPPDCPVDLCCIVYKIGIFIDEALFFLSRLIATFWQNWAYRNEVAQGMPVGPFLIPVEFIEFFFCDEYRGQAIGGPLGSGYGTPAGVVNPQGTTVDKCGKLEPVLQALGQLLTGCLCTPSGNGIFNIVDNFLQWFLAFVSNQTIGNPFPISLLWPRCLCNGGPNGEGIIPPLGNIIVIILRQISILVRNLNNPSYWAPQGGSFSNTGFASTLGDNLADIDKTWISRFLSPFAQGLCTLITNAGCLLSMILGNTCEMQRYNVLSSIVIYVMQAIIRVIAIIEAFAKLFAQELPGQCVGNPDTFVGSSGVGAGSTGTGTANVCAGNGVTTAVLTTGVLNADSLGSILVALLTFIADALLGVGRLTCTHICPLEASEYVFNPTTGVITPGDVACACYNKTPYTAKPEYVCNFETCKTFGAPNDVCLGASECSLAVSCGSGVNPPSTSNCPRYNPLTSFYFPFLFSQCNGGCKNMTEPVVPKSVIQATWDQAALTAPYPWYPSTIPALATPMYPLGPPICTMNGPAAIIDEARNQFGPGEGGTAMYQKICTRTDCINRGFCKNDQMYTCGPGDPRGVIDGIIMAALKYIRCLLDIIYSGLGGLIEPVIVIISFLWQLSGGVIRFAVALFIFIFKIVVRPIIVNIFSLIPDTLTLLIWFFNIFTQPVVLAAKEGDYVNPLQQEQADKYGAMFFQLFGTNLDGCIDDPIPCFCDRFGNMSATCNKNIHAVTLSEVMDLVSLQFDGITLCDSLIQHCGGMHPTKWVNVAYSERYQYIQCVAKRIQGNAYADHTTMWPKDFFYSQDAYYKLYMNMKDHLVQHVTRVSKAEEDLRKQNPDGIRWDRLQERLNARAHIFDNHLEVYHGVDKDHPAHKFLINMDSFWHKYNLGVYHYLGRKAWTHFKRGDVPLGSLKDSVLDLHMAVNEIIGSFKYLGNNAYHVKHMAVNGIGAAGEAAHDLVFNGARNWKSLHGKIEVPETPILIKKALDGTLWSDFAPTVSTNIVGSLTTATAHIWRHIRQLDVRIRGLEWMEKKWTPLKLYNYEAFQRLAYGAYHRVWPQHTPINVYERFILDGNCRVVDGTVDLAASIVTYCSAQFNASIPTDKYVYESRYPGGQLRPRVRVPETPRNPRYSFDRHTYRRAMTPPGTPAGMFNLLDAVVCWIEDLFNLSLVQGFDETVEKINAWFVNPNIDPDLYPDVGFRYWITFPFRCEFPHNLNCSIGIGLEEALIQVTKWFLIIFLVSAFLFPSLLSLLGGAAALVLWFFIVLAVGFHYSPACLVMWPSYGVRPGLTIPLFPLPISTFAFPECTWDEIIGVTDKYITNDYSFLINASLVNSPIALPCDEKIDFINCKDVGVSDGLQNILYFMYKWLGAGFVEVVVGLAGTTLGRIFPGLEPYLRQTLDRFRTASPTQAIQQDFCAKWTLPSIALVGVIVLPVALFILAIVPALINVGVAFYLMFRSSAFYDPVVEEGEPTEYDTVTAEDTERLPPEEQVQEEEEYVQVQRAPGIGMGMAHDLVRWFVPTFKKKKLKTD